MGDFAACGGDRRSTAPDSCRLLEKAGENFNYTKCVRFI